MLAVQHHIQDRTTENKDEYGTSEDERIQASPREGRQPPQRQPSAILHRLFEILSFSSFCFSMVDPETVAGLPGMGLMRVVRALRLGQRRGRRRR